MKAAVAHLISLGLALLVPAVQALSPADWRTQSIYFLLTDRFARTDGSTTASCDVTLRDYCGGSWQGIINKLDYIQGMGFTAIWITPVTGQFYESTGDGSSYHGYWQQDIYAVNNRLGTAADLKALSDALHARGMHLMVDVVANHMGYDGNGATADYSVFHPFNTQSYFHPYCSITNYDNQTNVEQCWLGDTTVALPDLATDTDVVRDIWYSWVTELVANYSIDGLRVDTIKHVQETFWPGYNDAAGVYCVGEVLDGDPDYTCPYQNYIDGVLNYPIYYPLLRAFQSTTGSISSLYSMITEVATECADTTLLGNFVENHDQPRFASYTSDLSLAKNALAFLFFSDGIPIVYAGQEQHYSGGNDPENREATWLSGYATDAPLYTFLQTTNQIRALAAAHDTDWATSVNVPFYQDSNTLGMRKGSTAGKQVITVLSNQGADGSSYTLTLGGSESTAGALFVELYSCTTVMVDSSGNLGVPMASGLPRVLVPSAWVDTGGLCGKSATTTTTPTPTSTTTTTTSCTETAATATVNFHEKVATTYGESVLLAGSITELGSWSTSKALALSSANYTADNPVWTLAVALAVGTSFEYKFLKTEVDGSVVWESDPNRAYKVPTVCEGTASVTVSTSWQ